VLRAVYDAGFGFECVSPGEVKHVLALFPDLQLIDSAAPASTALPFRGGRLLFTPNFAPRSTNTASDSSCGCDGVRSRGFYSTHHITSS
jgi:hypothetical protein